MNKYKILLTGGNGMVGRNILEHPSIENFEIKAPSSRELDLRDYHAVKSFFFSYKPDMVIHAAGKVGGIQANIREPVSFFVDNMDMGRNVVFASKVVGVKRMINLGSSCMYPRNHLEPLVEEMILKGELEPTNEGYALAKVAISRLCDYVMQEDNTYQYKTIIPCNLYGKYDKFNPSNSHLIPSIIHKIYQAKKEGLSTVEVWGDGTARREFMYAGDLADAIVWAVNNFEKLPLYLNLGIGNDYSINDYYRVIAEVLGYDGKFKHDISKPTGMFRKLLNIDKQKAIGWNAKTDLVMGIERTYNYYIKETLE